jgi:hypothetical protein
MQSRRLKGILLLKKVQGYLPGSLLYRRLLAAAETQHP